MARRRKHYYGDFGEYDMGDFGDFGVAGREHIAGPLIGGGIAQGATLATKLAFPAKAKWAGTIGFLAGGIVSGILASRPRFRQVGISGLVTAALVGIPRQIEDLMTAPGATQGYLGVITPEQIAGMGAGDVELLDSGSGAGTIGVITPEEGVSGFGAQSEIEMMGAGGAGGFGSNFFAAA
jgi:hypothetical protein